MYIVTIKNGNRETQIHGMKQKLMRGNVVKGINVIDSFSFSLLPSNAGFGLVNDFQTLVCVYNTHKNRAEFHGRVLYSASTMEESGLIYKNVVCESYLGFLCDSQQKYVVERNWTVKELFQHIINVHNEQVEDYKRFELGNVTVTDPNDNLYVGIQRENSWKTIEEKLIGKLGGEISFRVVDDVIYLDYVEKLGETLTTPIKLSRNMKSITRENNPLNYISRLIPLGAKLTAIDEDGNEYETEERLDITSVNEGLNYVESEDAKAVYGIRYATVEFDDVTTASALLSKGREYLAENNKIQIKHSVNALDLSLIGLDINDFDIYNYYPIENSLLGIKDTARIIKKDINICNETTSTIEFGDNFKTLTDIQIEERNKTNQSIETIKTIEKNYVTNELLRDETETLNSLISQMVDLILLEVSKTYVSTEGLNTYKKENSTSLELLEGQIVSRFNTVIETITDVDGVLKSKLEQLTKEIVASKEGLVIRSNNNYISLRLDNEDGIVFSKNGIPFGKWDGENFYTGNIVIEVNERAQFGNFAFVPRSDGSLSFLKVGDRFVDTPTLGNSAILGEAILGTMVLGG